MTATDGDTADILTYSLSGPDAASFTIEQAGGNNVGGEIKVKAGTKLDHETKPTHMVTVTATDPGGLSASIDVTITVTDVNEAPEITLGGLVISGDSSVEVEEGKNVVAIYTATGPDAASATWTLGGDDDGAFSISSSGELTFASVPDYENPADADTDNVYMVTVEAGDGTYMDTHEVTVTVTNVEEPGTVTLSISGNSNPEVEEEMTAVATYTASGPDAASATWTLGGDDDGAFSISSSGELTFASVPDYENPADADTDNVYMVTVEADDGTYTDTHEVTVTVTNAEEPGTATLSSDMLIVGEPVTASVTDPDVVTAGTEMWQWERADDAGFTMNVEDIAGATMASYTPVEADDGKYLRASVSYDDGYDADNSAMSSAIMVSATDGTLLERYDADSSGAIDKPEMIEAINDYLFGSGASAISKEDMIEVINLYLFG